MQEKNYVNYASEKPHSWNEYINGPFICAVHTQEVFCFYSI